VFLLVISSAVSFAQVQDDASLGRQNTSCGRFPRQLTKSTKEIRWDENAGLRRDAIRSQVVDALEAQEIRLPGWLARVAIQ
jgi:hypothetical protein